jgi:hypothetical protein
MSTTRIGEFEITDRNNGSATVAFPLHSPSNVALRETFGYQNVMWKDDNQHFLVQFDGAKTNMDTLKRLAEVQSPQIAKARESRAAAEAFIKRPDLTEKFPNLKFGVTSGGNLAIHGIQLGSTDAIQAIKAAGAQWQKLEPRENVKNRPDENGEIKAMYSVGGYWRANLADGRNIDQYLSAASAGVAQHKELSSLGKSIESPHEAISLAIKDTTDGVRIGVQYPKDNTANEIMKDAGFKWAKPAVGEGAFVATLTPDNAASIKGALEKTADHFKSFVVEPTRDMPGISGKLLETLAALKPTDDTAKALSRVNETFTKAEAVVVADAKPGQHRQADDAPRIAGLSDAKFASLQSAVKHVTATDQQRTQEMTQAAIARLQPVQAPSQGRGV